MERLTKRQKNGDAMWVRGENITRPGYTQSRICEVLCKYEDAEEQGQMLIAPREVDDWLYAIIYDEIFHTYDVSEHCITDFCLSGTIITDAPVGDPNCEIWTPEDQKKYYVCFSEEEAEIKATDLTSAEKAKLKELEG